MTQRSDPQVAPGATVLICSRERPDLLLETVESVLAGGTLPSELLVVDQSRRAHDRLARLGVVCGCEVRYLHSGTTGLSRARNIGLRGASNGVVVLIDDDMLVEVDWLERLLAGHAEAGPRGVATGRVLPAADERGSAGTPAASLVTRDSPAIFRGRQPGDVVPGANVAVHRHAVLAIGGYDERLGAGTRFAAADDNDIGFRLLEAGSEVRHVPDAVVYHRAWRSRRARLRLRWDYGRGKGAFYAKHLQLADRYILGRLGRELRNRFVRAVASIPRSPRVAVQELVSIGGIVSGALSWTARERLRGGQRGAEPGASSSR